MDLRQLAQFRDDTAPGVPRAQVTLVTDPGQSHLTLSGRIASADARQPPGNLMWQHRKKGLAQIQEEPVED
jgi:hypothetical protein